MGSEPVITPTLVRRLLQEQHPDLGELKVGEIVQGWDNTMVRLGDRLALRLPRHEMGERLLGQEIQWLPVLGLQTGVRVPAAVRTGVPLAASPDGPGYPYRWAVVPWTAGRSAGDLTAEMRDAYAEPFARTVAALHVPGAAGAPVSPVGRGQGIETVLDRVRERLRDRTAELGERQVGHLGELIQQALDARPHEGPPRWLHGDPHPRNTVLTAAPQDEGPGSPQLVDFGDLCVGDPASDLGQSWDHFTRAGRERFRAAYGQARGLTAEDDQALWTRARGWAVHYALIYLDPHRPEDLRRAGGRMLEVLDS